MRIGVLMTVHNRKACTLACLENLFSQKLPEKTEISVFLVDDGSTDGTALAVHTRFPTVNVIRGDGTLYWNQGMRRCWEEASREDFDAYLWLNDDSNLEPDAIKQLSGTLDSQLNDIGTAGIVVGACFVSGSSTGEKIATYGGRMDKRIISPSGSPQSVQTFNGNVVLVSRNAFRQLGNLSPEYRHSFGDFDYGFRARQKSIPVWLTAGYVAECPRNGIPAWRDANRSLTQRWKSFQDPKRITAKELRNFQKVKGRGFWWYSMMRIYLEMLFPRLFN